MVNAMFYTINQNNSGGYFIRNDKVSDYVIVEADTPDQANFILNGIVEYHSEYCDCCGLRWYIDFDDRDGDLEPLILGNPISESEINCDDIESCIIYYANGDKRRYKIGTKEWELLK